MNIWLTILGMAAVTYSVRLLPLTTLNVETLPLWIKRALRYVPIAVLSAIVTPEYLPGNGWFQYTVDAHWWAGLAAITTAWLTHSTLLTMGVGMAVLLLLS